ncbi:MAG: NAD(+) synthase [Methanobacteriota archaeon]|nr:MAG: NAD(+) synthase [Euryarchaeota archaeon]
MSAFGFVRLALCVPSLKVADVVHNLKEHKKLIEESSRNGARIIAFPELSLTGYSCDDLFHNAYLQEQAILAIQDLAVFSKKYPDHLLIVGVPLSQNGTLFNGAAVFNGGRMVGYFIKTFPPNYNEFKEDIYFEDAPKGNRLIFIPELGNIPMGNELIFEDAESDLALGLEICEDLWSPLTPSQLSCLSGSEVIVNLSASNEIIGKALHRNELVKIISDKLMCAYCFVSAGLSESTAEMVFAGHSLIYELGEKITENPPFSQNEILYGDIDVQLVKLKRIRNTTWKKAVRRTVDIRNPFKISVKIGMLPKLKLTKRPINRFPFLPYDPSAKDIFDTLKSPLVREFLQEAFSIQSHGLAKRFQRSGSEKLILNLSGGVDSTLAFLVALESLSIVQGDKSQLIALTLPGPGTSSTTLSLVRSLCKAFDIALQEIPIIELVEAEMNAIGLKETQGAVFENLQARIRTQIGFNVANKEKGILIGTGDLSEIALGWMTYNGDHMSSYAVNASIPKTLVQLLIKWYAAYKSTSEQQMVLEQILSIPISPELVPSDGELKQKTEEIIGPYELHDFFLYHFVKNQFSPPKIEFLAIQAFKGRFQDEDIRQWLKIFLSRFFHNQFKRSSMPEGPKVTSISLSPRSEWRMKGDIPDSWSNSLT